MAAQFMSQEEIDAMLSGVSGAGDDGNGPAAELPADRGFTGSSGRVLRWKKPPVKKFAFAYKSPVIKRRDVIYNPPPRERGSRSGIEVYSLALYQEIKSR